MHWPYQIPEENLQRTGLEKCEKYKTIPSKYREKRLMFYYPTSRSAEVLNILLQV